jgi:hypothetical protein
MEERLERKKIKKACGHSDEGTLAGKVDAVQYVILLGFAFTLLKSI